MNGNLKRRWRAFAVSLLCLAGTAAAAEELSSTPTDLVVFYHRDADVFKFTKTIDGTRRLDSADALVRNGHAQCYVVIGAAYQALGNAEEADALLHGEIARAVGAWAGNRALKPTTSDCVQEGQFVTRVDVLAVQRQLLPLMPSLPEFAEFVPLTEVKYQTLVDRLNERRQAAARREQAAAARRAELSELAQGASTDKVGSLTLNLVRDDDKTISICTLEYTGPSAQAILGYAHQSLSYVSGGFRSRATAAGATIDAKWPITATFATLDALYAELQRNPNKCQLYVDFPKNLKLLTTAIERDQGRARYDVNALIPVPELREAWAKKRGYPDLAASEFAAELKVGAATVKSLAEQGIRDKAGFDAVVREMRAARYADSDAVNDVRAYLDDRAAAAGKPGATAVSVRHAREKAERLDAERREAEEAKRRADYAREFPYTATISCGFNGSHINLLACLNGKYTKSQLELTNGSAYRMYQPWEALQAGRETRDGLVIPLRSSFKLVVGNDSENLLLTVKIVANATGRTVFTKSASQYGTIRVSQ